MKLSEEFAMLYTARYIVSDAAIQRSILICLLLARVCDIYIAVYWMCVNRLRPSQLRAVNIVSCIFNASNLHNNTIQYAQNARVDKETMNVCVC